MKKIFTEDFIIPLYAVLFALMIFLVIRKKISDEKRYQFFVSWSDGFMAGDHHYSNKIITEGENHIDFIDAETGEEIVRNGSFNLTKK